MKKKVAVFSVVIALIAITVVGGSLAWFVDSDQVENVFTIGSVEIEQIEQQREVDPETGAYTGKLEEFTDGKQLMPVIDNDNGTADPNFEDKIVTVENTGKNDAWVQTYVAIPKALNESGVLHVHTNQGADSYGWNAPVAAGTVVESAITGGTETVEYNVYKFVYKTTLASGATTDALMNGIYLDEAADMDVVYDEEGNITSAHFVMNGATVTGFDATREVKVYVATQAVQADGFGSAEVALDTAFGTQHPWVTND